MMTMIRVIVLYMLTTVAIYAAPAADLAALLNSLHTMRADFTQTILDNKGKVVQKAYGKMALQRPGKFRWEVSRPIPQLIVANATRLWIYDPDLAQVTIRQLHQAAGESPAVLLSHENASIEKDYTVTRVEDKSTPTWEWFSLAPRGADSMLTKVKMGFENKSLQEMVLVDHLGHTTKIRFQHAQHNVDIPSTLFVFKSPPNVDVIDETKRQRR